MDNRIKITEIPTDKSGLFYYGGLAYSNSVKVDNLLIKLVNYQESSTRYLRHNEKVRTYLFEILNDDVDPYYLPYLHIGKKIIEYQRKSSDHKTIFYRDVQNSPMGTVFRVSGIIDSYVDPRHNPHIWRVIKHERV